jgi:hypothetical protein
MKRKVDLRISEKLTPVYYTGKISLGSKMVTIGPKAVPSTPGSSKKDLSYIIKLAKKVKPFPVTSYE